MNCPNCKNQMVKAKATDFGEEYDYCRVCKKELKEMQSYAGIDFGSAVGARCDGVNMPRLEDDVYAKAAKAIFAGHSMSQSQKPPFNPGDIVEALCGSGGFIKGNNYVVSSVGPDSGYSSGWVVWTGTDSNGRPNGWCASKFKLVSAVSRLSGPSKPAQQSVMADTEAPCTNVHVFNPNNSVGACNCGGFIL